MIEQRFAAPTLIGRGRLIECVAVEEHVINDDHAAIGKQLLGFQRIVQVILLAAIDEDHVETSRWQSLQDLTGIAFEEGDPALEAVTAKILSRKVGKFLSDLDRRDAATFANHARELHSRISNEGTYL